MAKGVVDRLEPIHVAEEDKHVCLQAARQLDHALGKDLEASSVIQAGEVVRQAYLLELLAQLCGFGDIAQN